MKIRSANGPGYRFRLDHLPEVQAVSEQLQNHERTPAAPVIAQAIMTQTWRLCVSKAPRRKSTTERWATWHGDLEPYKQRSDRSRNMVTRKIAVMKTRKTGKVTPLHSKVS